MYLVKSAEITAQESIMVFMLVMDAQGFSRDPLEETDNMFVKQSLMDFVLLIRRIEINVAPVV
jgi:hypothetical protein